MEINLCVEEIATIVQAREVRGDRTLSIRSIASLDAAQPGDLSFLGNPKYRPDVATTAATVLLLPLDYPSPPKPGQAHLLVEKPSLALARLCTRLEQKLWPRPAPGIHPSAIIDASACIDPSATIGPLCVIEAGATIGARVHLQAQVYVGRAATIAEDCWLMPQTHVATECKLGPRVRLQPGVVIGSDGFGYEFQNGRHEKVPQVGNVIVEADVEIGANAAIDRARFGLTRIGEGTKIDNLVQIGHNVLIGRHCILCGQVAVAGSTTIEDYVVIGGQAALAGHITVGKGAKIAGQAGVISDLAPGAYVKGNVGLPYLLEQRINVLRQRLPELFRRVDSLEAQIKKSSASA